MTLGIGIHHALHSVREDRDIRTDHAGLIGVVPRSRWPDDAGPGDFVELRVDRVGELDTHPVMGFFDAATKMAARAFFANGGASLTLYGLCVTGSRDLLDPGVCASRLQGLLERLCDDEEVSLLAMPALAWLPASWDGRSPSVGATEAVRRLARHCAEVGHRFLLVDAPQGADEALVTAWVDQIRAMPDIDASYLAVYFPWLMAGDTPLAPSGAVAGVIARTDREHGPHGVRVPPANQEVRGFTHAAVDLTWRQGAGLVEAGVNPVLEQPGRGLVVWGARTLSAEQRWRQITARRIVSYITERVRRDAEWVVFEQMRPELWETVARMVRSRLDVFWSAGLLTGEAPGNDYLVQCDAELNPPSVRDAGVVQVKMLIRPIQATEYIEVELALGA